MRTAAASTLLMIAAATVLVGSCYWAWADDDFWRPIPLYPAVLATGVLATAAIYAHTRQRLRAASLGTGIAIMTLTSTAVITLLRWHT